MRNTNFIVGWGCIGAAVAFACGGSADNELFGSSGGDAAASSSGASSGSSGDTSSSGGSSGTSSSGAASSGAASSSGTTSSSGTSGTVDAGPKTCRPSVASDCAQDEYCKVTACATAGGTCTKKPSTVPQTGSPVCGCDNVTYWNVELAATFGVSVRLASGVCPSTIARVCKGTTVKCPDKRYCNFDVGGNSAAFCSKDTTAAEGTCWGVPETCPVRDGRMRACASPLGDCTSYCEAVKKQTEFFNDNSCN